MFLLSRKGSILLLLGTGLLLGLLAPSEAIKCFACDPEKTTKEADCQKQVDCEDPVNSCQTGWDIDSNGTKTFTMDCGRNLEGFSSLCTSVNDEGTSYKICHCFQDLCNDDQSLNSLVHKSESEKTQRSVAKITTAPGPASGRNNASQGLSISAAGSSPPWVMVTWFGVISWITFQMRL